MAVSSQQLGFDLSCAHVQQLRNHHARRSAAVVPTGIAPFIRIAEDASGNRRVDDGAFGPLPGFAKELAYGRKTYNARTETVSKLPSFHSAWK